MSASLGLCSHPYPWAQCIFETEFLNRFDADHLVDIGAPSVLEVHFCTTGTDLSINLYYGTYPWRKRLRLLTQQQEDNGVEAGCYTRFFSPFDAECPEFPDPLEPDDPANLLPEACRHGCDNGRWVNESEACLADYDDVPLFLTAEFCAGTGEAGALSITELTLRHHGASCVCTSDDGCRDLAKPICDRSARLPHAACDSGAPRCAGVCIPP